MSLDFPLVNVRVPGCFHYSRRLCSSSLSYITVLQLNFKTTWGDPYYLGLTGIEVLGYDGLPITLTEEQLQVMNGVSVVCH